MQETQTTFTIYRDGEIDPDFARQQRIQAIQQAGSAAIHDVWRISRHLAAPLARVVGECATNLHLDIVDAQNGSHLRREYFAKKRELAEAAIREEYGL